MDKFSELKAAAMAATPGPWGINRTGNTIVSNQSHPVATVSDAFHRQLAGGGVGNDAAFIAAANPVVVLELLSELEAKDKRIAEQEAKLATPVDVQTEQLRQIKADIAARKAMPEYGESIEGNIERLRVIGATRSHFSTEAVEMLVRALEEQSRALADAERERDDWVEHSRRMEYRAIEAKELLANREAQPVADGENCWSCGNFFTYAQHSECDGYCPHCNAPVDLDEEEIGDEA